RPTGATVCSLAYGQSWARSASCANGNCCGFVCRDVQTDTLNCGACGTVCNGTNGTPTFSSGSCGIICGAAFLNCNGSLIDGCEVNRTSDVQNCNGCGNACPGQGQASANAACVSSACAFSCVGENYDVDNNPSNGCEWIDSPTGNHTNASATSLGSHDCTDSTVSFNGTMLSDSRSHSPAINGFDSA